MKYLFTPLLIPAFLWAVILHIPGDYPTIQSGINSSTDGDTVLVQPGTYLENINFNGRNITLGSLYITIGDTSYISQTIIDGNQEGTVVSFIGGEDESACLSGVTITNGLAAQGGGLYFEYQSSPVIDHVIIRHCTANVYGGAALCVASSPWFRHCSIHDNIAHEGGGLFITGEGDPRFDDCRFADNTATVSAGGGAITCFFAFPTISNSLFTGNISNGRGGALRGTAGSLLTIVNCTFVDNFAPEGSALELSFDGRAHLVNCILWDNSYPQIMQQNHAVWLNVSHCLVANGIEDINNPGWDGLNWLEGNITGDPLFLESDDYPYLPQPGSPCINSGTDFLQLGEDIIVDLPADQFYGPAPDMGWQQLYYLFGDLNSDGLINVQDIILAVEILLNPSDEFDPITMLNGDLNGDGIVNILDVIMIINVILEG